MSARMMLRRRGMNRRQKTIILHENKPPWPGGPVRVRSDGLDNGGFDDWMEMMKKGGRCVGRVCSVVYIGKLLGNDNKNYHKRIEDNGFDGANKTKTSVAETFEFIEIYCREKDLLFEQLV
ncbi:hypothetical protein LWI28_001200 [Acer negundo]|uniref:Uncharacterized protein n=1 Tax=Acer negundo TaxID=4023 RepID=A0AAD5J9J7_ACENE|nr:hypothetical protein LWI28_001200 [Acer negundo]